MIEYELELFAGAGGGILGGHLNGWTCVGAVECEGYPRGVLAARQNDGALPAFPIWSDVRSFTKRNNACRRFFRALRRIRGRLIVKGGFPCQDISAAGKGAGIDGERSGLWREFARILRELRPGYVLVENSPVLTGRGLDRVLGDLAALGYDAVWGVLGAVDAGAPHKRDRIWIVAYLPELGRGTGWARGSDPGRARESEQPLQAVADAARIQSGREIERAQRQRIGPGGESIDVCNALRVGHSGPATSEGFSFVGNGPAEAGQCERGEIPGAAEPAGEDDPAAGRAESHGPQSDGHEAGRDGSSELCGDVSDTLQHGLQDGLRGHASGPGAAGEAEQTAEGRSGSWWLAEPAVGRVADGVAHRVDRLKALGNGQVPAVVRLAWEILGARAGAGNTGTHHSESDDDFGGV